MVKETKLYDTLAIKPDASQDEIKKAYRKKAIATHPDKNKDNPKAAEEFKEVGQAYEVLSNPETRRDYDTFGLEYVLSGGQKGAPPPQPDNGAGFGGFGGSGGFPGMAGAGGRQFHFSTSGGHPGFSFTDPENLFSTFWAEQGGSHMEDDPFANLTGGMGGGRNFGGKASRFRDPHKRATTPEVQAVEKDLPVTLEQLFHGTKKKLKISRKTYDQQTGKRKVEEKPLEVDIKAGFKEGTKIKYKGWGDQEESGAQDLHFVIKQKPHERFIREGDDLRTKIHLDLKEALTGWEKTVTNIEGRQIRVTAPTPTQPGYEIRFPDQGMPKSKRPGQRGDMIVEVSVKFPASLTPQQKQQISLVL